MNKPRRPEASVRDEDVRSERRGSEDFDDDATTGAEVNTAETAPAHPATQAEGNARGPRLDLLLFGGVGLENVAPDARPDTLQLDGPPFASPDSESSTAPEGPSSATSNPWFEQVDSSLVGVQLGPYRVRAPLGSGAFARVYEAVHERAGHRVALKVLRTAQLDDPHAIRRLERELAALSSLRHPNVVSLLDFGHEEGLDFIALELVDGPTLAAERAQRGPMDEEQTRELGVQLARGLAHAHAHGLVHRDLKPANVLLAPNPMGGFVAKIADFGLARFSGPSELTALTGRGALGTPAFLAPEQIRGTDAGPPSDLYALGAILFDCLTGRPPFEGSVDFVLRAKRESPAPKPPGHSRLGALVAALLEPDPRRRPQSATEVEAQLLDLGPAPPPSSRPGDAQETSPIVAQVHVSRGPRWMWLTLVSLGLVSVVVAGPFMLQAPVESERVRSNATSPELRPAPSPRPRPIVALEPPSSTPAPSELAPNTRVSNERRSETVRSSVVQRDLLVRLAKKGLRRRDLDSLGDSVEAKAMRQAFMELSSSRTVDLETSMRWREQLERFEPNAEVLDRKLERLRDRLREVAGNTSLEGRAALQNLEDRYFDLKKLAAPGGNPGTPLARLLEMTSELEDELSTLAHQPR